MKMTFACPKCKTHKTVEGKPGEKKLLVCNKCGEKGKGTFPDKKTKGFILTKKQVIAIPVLSILLLLCFSLIILPSMNGDLHFLTVQSGSMEPNLSVGDVVISAKSDIDDIKVGDVITFRYSSDNDPYKCYTHRVNKIINTEDGNIMFQTKGDANEDVDRKLVRSSEVIGKSVVILPFIGYIGDFARSKLGYVVFLVIPCLLIIVFETRRIFKTRKKENPT